jgi:hypothetical protein
MKTVNDAPSIHLLANPDGINTSAIGKFSELKYFKLAFKTINFIKES